MSGRRAVVFGGSGFIGRYVVRRLAADAWVVRVGVRDPEAAKFLKPMGAVGQITPIAADVRSRESIERLVDGVDAAVNLVGILAESGGQRFDRVHVQGARNIAEAAASAGVRKLVHLSAIGADPGSPAQYGRTKAGGEAAVRELFPEATILRPSIVFGVEDQFFNRFAQMARLSPALPLIGGGRTRFQPVYVGDVAEATWRALTVADAAGKTFELGGPRTLTFREVLEYILEQIGRRRILLPLPTAVATLQASLLELLPNPPLTRDQVKMLERDNVVAGGALGFADLGIDPTGIAAIVPAYLERFRSGGRFAQRAL